jgi:hypothetical protein
VSPSLIESLQGKHPVATQDLGASGSDLAYQPLQYAAVHSGVCGSLDQVSTCKLEPGGIFYFQAKTPPVAERQHKEVLTRLDQLSIDRRFAPRARRPR